MKEIMFEIGNDVHTIKYLPEFSFEAMEEYKQSLSLVQAINEGQRLVEIQKRKVAQEEERRRREEERAAAEEAEKKAVEKALAEAVAEEMEAPAKPVEVIQEPVYTLDFRVTATKEQLDLLKGFLRQNNITYGPVPTLKGE